MGGAPWQLPGFVVGELLGSGSSSEVWAARIAATGERVALKRVALTEPDALRAARTEAALLTALDHPHLVRLHALIPTPEAAVLVLDLADGGSLADMLARRSRLAVGEVVTALAPIGAALAYAHQRGVLHGDVTPGNVLFTSIGLPMLGDLGVARIVGDSVAVRCTPEYIDPAVARGFVAGPSSDVFMLGAIAMRALTGSPVWRGTTTAGILADAAAGDLGHLRERFAGLPPPVVAVLEQALVAEPHLRCTAAEFALDLRHSAVPMPVELSAGRGAMTAPGTGRATAGRVSDSPRPPGAHRAMARRRLGRRAVPDPDQPAFDRPGPAPATSGHEGALTYRVRASARPTLPPPPGRFRRFLDRASSTASVRRSFRLGLIALVVGAIALGGGLLWSSRPSPADAARRPTDAARLPSGCCPPAYGRCPPARGRPDSRPECLAAIEQLALAGRCLAPAGRPSRASLCPPRRGATHPGVRSRALVGRGFGPATTARTRRMWVGGRSHGVPQRAGVKAVGWTVEYPGDGAARAVDLALRWRRPWSRGRCRTDRTAY
jgi:Protein kinase domain